MKFSYNGTNYHGWQSQPNAVSVQETLEKAVSVILNQTTSLIGAGRTDTGVHAKIMFAHFDSDAKFDSDTVIHKLNSFLPKDIAVSSIISVHEQAHARFDATQRTYEYQITTVKEVFANDLSWHYQSQLDIELMNQAAAELQNYTDFQCFSKVHTDVNTFNCKITKAFWIQTGDRLIFTISADRFLRNMVRAIVGTLIDIGLHKINLADFKAIIGSKDRSEAGFSVPAHGLYLTEIKYDYIT